MKKRKSTCLSRNFIHLFIQILSGNLGMRPIILTCLATVLLVLGYISMQIYISRLVEQNRELNRERTVCDEKINNLASTYASLSSRSRVVKYCERRLGMRQANGDDLVRVAVDSDEGFWEESDKTPVIGIWFDDNLALRLEANSARRQ